MTDRVLDHHLSAFEAGVDEVLKDYTESSVLIATDGVYEGLDAIRDFYERFVNTFPDEGWEAFSVIHRRVLGELGLVVWEAPPYVETGTDTFVVRDGKIAYQTFAAR